MTNYNRYVEHGSNAFSTFSGLFGGSWGPYGAAWGVGWEMGRAITTIPAYQDWKEDTYLVSCQTKFVRVLILTKMIKILDVLYYNYYKFCSRRVNELVDPHFNAVLTLSFSEALFLSYSIDTIGAYMFCRFVVNRWTMLFVLVLVLSINCTVYLKLGRGVRIERDEPTLCNSKKISKALTIGFIFFSISLLFWVTDYNFYVINKCK
jgi:hypothetical protein